MTSQDPIAHYFWDACVFVRFLTGTPTDYVSDITQMIDDAKAGKARIYCSTMVFAEIRPSHLKAHNLGDISDLLQDLGGTVMPIGPTPAILERAGALKDISFANPNGGNSRVVGTADAIHLLTCVHLEDDLGISPVKFHTTDNGKGGNWEGKCVPLLTFEKWAGPHMGNPTVSRVCKLDRCLPQHSSPRLPKI